MGAVAHQFYVRSAAGRKDSWREEAITLMIGPAGLLVKRQEVGIRTDLSQLVFVQASQILLSEAPFVEQCPEHEPQL